MIVVVAAETLLLALLALFVVALLRSHAEILRRLELLSPGTALPRPEEATGEREAADLDGATPGGGARRIVLSAGPDTLLAFLSTDCSVCRRLLDALDEPDAKLPPGLRLVVVTKDRELERLRLLRPLEGRVDVVMSSEAWASYGVPGSPYFVQVDGASGRVVGEGSAGEWEQVVSLIVDAGDDHAPDVEHRDRIDDALAAAGIEPGHSSLHPGAATQENGR